MSRRIQLEYEQNKRSILEEKDYLYILKVFYFCVVDEVNSVQIKPDLAVALVGFQTLILTVEAVRPVLPQLDFLSPSQLLINLDIVSQLNYLFLALWLGSLLLYLGLVALYFLNHILDKNFLILDEIFLRSYVQHSHFQRLGMLYYSCAFVIFPSLLPAFSHLFDSSGPQFFVLILNLVFVLASTVIMELNLFKVEIPFTNNLFRQNRMLALAESSALLLCFILFQMQSWTKYVACAINVVRILLRFIIRYSLNIKAQLLLLGTSSTVILVCSVSSPSTFQVIFLLLACLLLGVFMERLPLEQFQSKVVFEFDDSRQEQFLEQVRVKLSNNYNPLPCLRDLILRKDTFGSLQTQLIAFCLKMRCLRRFRLLWQQKDMDVSQIFSHEEYNERLIQRLSELAVRQISLIKFLQERAKFGSILVEESGNALLIYREIKEIIMLNHRLNPSSVVNRFYWQLCSRLLLCDDQFYQKLLDSVREGEFEDAFSRVNQVFMENRIVVTLSMAGGQIGSIIRASKRSLKYLGYSPQELLGRNVSHIQLKSIGEQHCDILTTFCDRPVYLNTTEQISLTYYALTKEFRLLLATVSVYSLINSTEEIEFSGYFEVLNDTECVCVTDMYGRIEGYNNAFQRQFGFDYIREDERRFSIYPLIPALYPFVIYMNRESSVSSFCSFLILPQFKRLPALKVKPQDLLLKDRILRLTKEFSDLQTTRYFFVHVTCKKLSFFGNKISQLSLTFNEVCEVGEDALLCSRIRNMVDSGRLWSEDSYHHSSDEEDLFKFMTNSSAKSKFAQTIYLLNFSEGRFLSIVEENLILHKLDSKVVQEEEQASLADNDIQSLNHLSPEAAESANYQNAGVLNKTTFSVPYFLAVLLVVISAVVLWQELQMLQVETVLMSQKQASNLTRYVCGKLLQNYSNGYSPINNPQLINDFDRSVLAQGYELLLVKQVCAQNCAYRNTSLLNLVEFQLLGIIGYGSLKQQTSSMHWLNGAKIIQSLWTRQKLLYEWIGGRLNQQRARLWALFALLLLGLLVFTGYTVYFSFSWISKDQLTAPFYRFEKSELDNRYRLLKGGFQLLVARSIADLQGTGFIEDKLKQLSTTNIKIVQGECTFARQIQFQYGNQRVQKIKSSKIKQFVLMLLLFVLLQLPCLVAHGAMLQSATVVKAQHVALFENCLEYSATQSIYSAKLGLIYNYQKQLSPLSAEAGISLQNNLLNITRLAEPFAQYANVDNRLVKEVLFKSFLNYMHEAVCKQDFCSKWLNGMLTRQQKIVNSMVLRLIDTLVNATADSGFLVRIDGPQFEQLLAAVQLEQVQSDSAIMTVVEKIVGHMKGQVVWFVLLQILYLASVVCYLLVAMLVLGKVNEETKSLQFLLLFFSADVINRNKHIACFLKRA